MSKHAVRQQPPGNFRRVDTAESLIQRGVKLESAGRLERAMAAYSAAAMLQPGHPGAIGRLAAVLALLGRHREAVATWERLWRLRPRDMNVAVGLGAALIAAGRPQDALMLVSAASAQEPANTILMRLNARALLALGMRGPAIGALYMALDQRPGEAETQNELGSALFHDGHPEMALAHCEAAFRLAPCGQHAASLSCVLIDLGRNEEALAVTGKGLEIHPNSLETLINRSIALQGLRRTEESVILARKAVAAGPDSALAKHHLAAALLAQGDLTPEAWELYEARLNLNGARIWPGVRPRWTGQDIAGKTVLLHAEQGLGDTLQFVRYAPLVAARGAKVILVVQPALARLLQGTPGTDQVLAVGERLPDFDVYCPLLSLPGVLGTTLETIPPALPYAMPLPAALEGGRLRVGLVWAGNRSFVDDRKRSLAPSALAPLAGLPGIEFCSLQVGGEAPPELAATDLTAGLHDFADTAAAVAELDLVVAVDTAVAHLAATMGKPVWLLSRFNGCWRWLHDREDTPWYPGMRIFRQTAPNDWPGVMARVRAELGRVQASTVPVLAA